MRFLLISTRTRLSTAAHAKPISTYTSAGRTGRAGRKGTAITYFTEDDVGFLRTIANVMKLSGCNVPAWMLNLKKIRDSDKVSGKPFDNI